MTIRAHALKNRVRPLSDKTKLKISKYKSLSRNSYIKLSKQLNHSRKLD